MFIFTMCAYLLLIPKTMLKSQGRLPVSLNCWNDSLICLPILSLRFTNLKRVNNCSCDTQVVQMLAKHGVLKCYHMPEESPQITDIHFYRIPSSFSEVALLWIFGPLRRWQVENHIGCPEGWIWGYSTIFFQQSFNFPYAPKYGGM